MDTLHGHLAKIGLSLLGAPHSFRQRQVSPSKDRLPRTALGKDKYLPAKTGCPAQCKRLANVRTTTDAARATCRFFWQPSPTRQSTCTTQHAHPASQSSPELSNSKLPRQHTPDQRANDLKHRSDPGPGRLQTRLPKQATSLLDKARRHAHLTPLRHFSKQPRLGNR